MTPRPEDPCRDPASEARDDHAVDESFDYRDPSKEDREPKTRLPAELPPDIDPPPSGFVYYGEGPLPKRLGATKDIKAWQYGTQRWTSDNVPLHGAITFPLAHCQGSPIWYANMVIDLNSDKV